MHDPAAGAGGRGPSGRRRPGAARRPSPAVECATGRRRRGEAPRRPPRCAPEPKGAGAAPGAMRPRPSREVGSITVTSNSAGTVAEGALGGAGSPRRRGSPSSRTWSSHSGSTRPGYASRRARSMLSFRERRYSMYSALRPPSSVPGTHQSTCRWSAWGAGPRRAPRRARTRFEQCLASAMSRDASNPGGSRPAMRAR